MMRIGKYWKKMASAALLASLVFLLAVSAVASGPAAGITKGGAGEPIYYFSGTGRAHGVGMCMDGVYYRAKAGWKYRDILNYYYTGITFSTTDEYRPIRVKGRDGQIRVWSMRDYMYHLQEEPDNYPMEELKALYVAARTYTLSCIDRNKHTAQGFDVCSSGDCCQACDENKNIANYPNSKAAVDATSGQIMTYGGKPITAAYCGSCGGHTENNEDVWGGKPMPYLRGKPDDFCKFSPRFSWTVTFPKSELEARLNSRADTQVGELYALDLSNRTPGGRVRTAQIRGSAAIKTVSGGTLQTLLGLPSTKFDMARPNFDEYLLLLNPNPEPTKVTFIFMRPDGTKASHVAEVDAKSRFTLKVNDYQQFQEVSAKVVSELPVIAERAMYFNYRNSYTGGNDCMGVPAPMPKWYLAEGYTGGAFETYVLIQNPNARAEDIRLTFMLPGGSTVRKMVRAKPSSRMTLRLNDIPGLQNTDVSTVVECASGDGIIAERSSYFNYYGCVGGTNDPGVPGTSDHWYLAEGYNGGRFNTYILLQNPGGRTASVKATFMKENGKNVKATYKVKPHSRYTIHANSVPGLEGAGFSTSLVSEDGVGFIAERAMYFDYDEDGIQRNGGHDSVGVNAPATRWYFAEGYTGGKFDTWLLIQNPCAKTARVRLTFHTPTGGAVRKEYSIKAHSRSTVKVDSVEGLSDTEVSTTVESTNGVKVIAERAMYGVYSDGYCAWDGGHDTAGVTEPSRTWYFAEGYTGF
jgi:SpoIID/LytB domain protein